MGTNLSALDCNWERLCPCHCHFVFVLQSGGQRLYRKSIISIPPVLKFREDEENIHTANNTPYNVLSSVYPKPLDIKNKVVNEVFSIISSISPPLLHIIATWSNNLHQATLIVGEKFQPLYFDVFRQSTHERRLLPSHPKKVPWTKSEKEIIMPLLIISYTCLCFNSLRLGISWPTKCLNSSKATSVIHICISPKHDYGFLTERLTHENSRGILIHKLGNPPEQQCKTLRKIMNSNLKTLLKRYWALC